MGGGIKNWELALCYIFGNLILLILSAITEYFTSNWYQPVRSLITLSEEGPIFNLISGNLIGILPQALALIVVLPFLVICAGLSGYIGVVVCTLGMLS